MKYDLALAITGEGKTSYANAHDLLCDLAARETIIIFPEHIPGNLKPVFTAIKDGGIFYTSSGDILQDLEDTTASQKFLIVLGTDGVEKDLEWAASMGIPVLDLTRGLYAVPQMPADGSVSESESPTAGFPPPVRGAKDLASQKLTEPGTGKIPGNDALADALEKIRTLEEEVKKLRPHVAVAETGKHYVNGIPDKEIPEKAEVLPEKTEAPDEKKIRCYRSKAGGKIRKADGRTKKRPGEEEVFLTPEEFEESK